MPKKKEDKEVLKQREIKKKQRSARKRKRDIKRSFKR